MEITKKIRIAVQLSLMAVAVCAFVACSSDDEITQTSLSAANPISQTNATATTITVEWDAVDNASQYGCRLLDANGNVVAGNDTTATTMTFTQLRSNETYTFELTSFAVYGGAYKNSDPVTLEVKTDPLPAPEISYRLKEIAGNNTEMLLVVNWNSVDEANQYYVDITGNDGTAITDTIDAEDKTSYSYQQHVAIGSTYNVGVTSVSAVGSVSETATTPEGGILVQLVSELWNVEGTFVDNAVYRQTVTRTLVAYSDGTYKLRDWIYEGSGYDLEFSVKTNGEIDVLNGGDASGDWLSVEYYPGGYSTWIATSNGNSSFSETDCSLEFYGSYGVCSFTWKKEDVNGKVCTVTYDPEGVFANVTSEIWKTGENQFVWKNFLGSGLDVGFTIGADYDGNFNYDASDMTKTFGSITFTDHIYDYYGNGSVYLMDDTGDNYAEWTPEGTSVNVQYYYMYCGSGYSYINFAPQTDGSYSGYFYGAGTGVDAGYVKFYFSY